MTVEAPLTERSRRTRAELGRATHACLAERGSIDVDTIVAAAGVSAATFYTHFASHDDALAAALDLALDRITAISIDEFHVEALLDRGVDEVARRLITRSHAAFRAESLVLRAALARLSSHREIREVYRDRESAVKTHLTRQIELAQKAGVVRPGPAEQRATALLVLLQGINNPLLTGRPRLDRHVSADLHRAITAALAA